MVGPLLFTPGEAPAYTRGLRANIALFTSVLCFVGITSVYLRWLNHAHGRRRVALGKNVAVVDASLETMENVGLLAAMRRGAEDASASDDDRPSDKAFSDATDLENEDFVFVY